MTGPAPGGGHGAPSLLRFGESRHAQRHADTRAGSGQSLLARRFAASRPHGVAAVPVCRRLASRGLAVGSADAEEMSGRPAPSGRVRGPAKIAALPSGTAALAVARVGTRADDGRTVFLHWLCRWGGMFSDAVAPSTSGTTRRIGSDAATAGSLRAACRRRAGERAWQARGRASWSELSGVPATRPPPPRPRPVPTGRGWPVHAQRGRGRLPAIARPSWASGRRPSA